MLDKIRLLRADHLKIQHDLTFYAYQDRVSDAIIQALIDNLRITAGATEEDVKKLKQIEVAIEQSRQSGKTYSVAHTCEFILTFLPTMFKRPIRIGIFAAQLDQAKISYGILRNSLRQAKATLFNVTEEEQKFIAEEENARRLVLPDGSSVVIAPINKVSQIEGLTLDLIIIDEAQVADDEVVKHSIWPMGKVNNAPRVYIGKAGTKICHFYRLSQRNDTLKIYFNDVVQERRRLYESSNDARHLMYEVSVSDDITKQGIDSDEIQREYFGKWQVGTGQFVVQEILDSLVDDRKITYQYKKTNCFAGIDTAKHPDSTVVTIIRDLGELSERKLPDGTTEMVRKKEVLNWLELRGENYQDQFDMIKFFLNSYNVVAMAIDSTGQGDFMPDMFQRHTDWQDENSGLYRMKFNATSKDSMYKNLKVSLTQGLTRFPQLNTKVGEKFRQQMLDLQQEYKGQLLSCHHPDTPDAHDDFPDSLALAEWAFARYNAVGDPQIAIAIGAQKERHVVKDENDEVRDYWPGSDW
jgi:hypothetical protein